MQPKFHRIRDPETLGKRIVFLLTQPDHKSPSYRSNCFTTNTRYHTVPRHWSIGMWSTGGAFQGGLRKLVLIPP